MGIINKKQLGVICLAASLVVMPTQAHWAQTSINRFVQMEVVKGYEGNYRLNDQITRGEFAVLMNRVLQYETAATHTYGDLKDTWYTQDMLKMAHAGLMIGDGQYLRPTATITRQEAAMVMYRAFSLNKQDVVEQFNDEAKIATWALDAVRTMQANGYINGRLDGKFDPQASITRAEMIKMLDKVATQIYTEDGTYTKDVQGNVIVTAKNITLEGGTVTGNILIGEGVQEVQLIHVDGSQKVVVNGGKVKIKGNLSHLLIQGNAQVELEQGTIYYVEVASNAKKSQVVLGEGAKVLRSSLPTGYTFLKGEPVTSSKPNQSGNTGNGGSTGGSGSNSGNGSNNGNENGSQEDIYQYKLQESFLMAPTWQLTLYEQGHTVTGYVLYANGNKIAEDRDRDGTVVIPKVYSNEKLYITLENQEEYKEIVLKEKGVTNQ